MFPRPAAPVLLLGLLLATPARAVTFQVQTVDSLGSDRGIHSSLALDSRGRPHVSYYGDNQLRYASKYDSTWTFETVDINVGFYTSLALDADDVPHICYFDSTNADVRYATKAPGYWVNQLVDSAGSVGQYMTIALDPGGNPGIAYYDATHGDLKYAKLVNGAWTLETADSAGDVGYYTSIAYDKLGQACVSYLDLDGGLKFARRTGAGWTTFEIEAGAGLGSFSSLALDSLGFARISYADLSAQSLKYAEETPLGWYTQTVDPSDFAGPYTSLRLDAAGDPHITYIAQHNKHLQYAARRGQIWSFDDIDHTTSVTHHNSLALDPYGNPMVSYYDEIRTNLKFADASLHLIEPHGGEFWMAGSYQNVVWTGVGPVDVYLSRDNGATYTKVTSSPDPYHVVPIQVPAWNSATVRVKIVRDSPLAVSETYGTLTVAQNLSTPWWTKLVDGAGLTGFNPSMRLTASGSPRIAYWSATDAGVRYASRTGGVWTSELLQGGMPSRTNTSLAINAFGVPSIAYFDGTRLKWAYRLNGSWTSEVAVPLIVTGEHCSQALDRTARPRVSYFDRSQGLVLAARFGTSWATEIADPGDSVGLWSSLALDSIGHPFISYCDAKAGDLKFAAKPGSFWEIENVDAVGRVGLNTSLALDAQTNPYISYVDATNGFLKVATKSNGGWRIETVDGSGRVGGGTSIALDPSGEPVIAYHDRIRRKLMIARHAGGFWNLEEVTPAAYAGTASSLALGPDGNPRLAYLDDFGSDLWYASSAVELFDVPPGSHWPVGSHRVIGWEGNGRVDLSFSSDAGGTFTPVASSLPGPPFGGTYLFLVPGPGTPHAMLRIDRTLPPSFSVTDTFAIQVGVDLLSFAAVQTLFGKGADVSWQTDPAVPDLSGYRLERSLGGAPYAMLVPLTAATAFHDDAAVSGTKYRLTAVNGVGAEFVLGETEFIVMRPLAAGPLPYRGGSLTISFAALAARTELRLYDIRGRLTRTIVRGDFPGGVQSVAWDGKDDKGRKVSSGLYVLKSTSGGHETSLKIMVVR